MLEKEYLKINREGAVANVNVVSFVDDAGYYNVYCPSLDVVGAGMSEDEAENSFRTTLEIDLEYMLTHNTLRKELVRLGWKEKPRSLMPPTMATLAMRNRTFRSIVNRHNFRKYNCQLSVSI